MNGALLGLAMASCQLLGPFLLGYLFRTDRRPNGGA